MGVLLVIATVVGLLAAATYFYYRYQQELKNNPSRELIEITKQVNKIMLLPESVLPTLATVTEKEKLSSQDFFKNAENGDKVLIYIAEGKAILYRPSLGKIIEVAPIKQSAKDPSLTDIGTTVEKPLPEPDVTQEAAETPTEEVTETISIVMYNGTTKTGLTTTVEKELTDLTFEFEVVDKQPAKSTQYPQTVIIDLTQSNDEAVRELAQKLGARIDSLPAEEVAPADADILIIVGADSIQE